MDRTWASGAGPTVRRAEALGGLVPDLPQRIEERRVAGGYRPDIRLAWEERLRHDGGVMMVVLADSGAVARIMELGAQFALLGSWALVFGALRLWGAGRTRRRLILLVGLIVFAVGLTAQSLVRLQVVELNYFPGWETDMNEVLGVDHADHAYADDDLEAGPYEPQPWESAYWWSQRLFLLVGALAAGIGFVREGGAARKGV